VPAARSVDDVNLRKRTLLPVLSPEGHDVVVDALPLQFRDVVVDERLGERRK
jgi:hypothetical protein